MKCTFLFFVLKPASLILFYLLFDFSSVHGQLHSGIVDTIEKRMVWYSQAQVSDILFVHFDKTIYANGERAWFSGYLLKSATDISRYNTMSIALIREDDRSIWAENKFVMQHGISSGDITLPDTIPPGNYHFIAYTNVTRNGYPDEVFSQPITVKTADSSFEANLILTDSITSITDTARVKLKVTTNEFVSIPNAEVTYTWGNGALVSSPRKLQTNKYGEAFMTIPVRQLMPSNSLLHVTVKNGFFFKELILKIPVLYKEARVKFYPEGGNLVEKTSCYIGWEVMNTEGEPLHVSGILYENKKAIDTIQTNEYGLGRFMIKGVKNSSYHVRVLYSYSKDTIYSLPTVLRARPAISVFKSVTADTLQLVIQNINTINRNSFLLIHNYKQIFLAYSLNNTQTAYEIKHIPLAKVPKGLATITLVDSSGKPLADRMFFAHYDERADVIVGTDSSQYSTRQKVQLSLKLKDTNGKLLHGIVSVACVENDRINFREMNDIESYTYLASELQNLPYKRNVLKESLDENEYMEDILLIKGWRRYTWTDVLTANATDTIQPRETFIFKGSVTRNTKPISKEVQLSLITASASNTITTDKSGNFELSPTTLIVPDNDEIVLFINQRNQALYKLSMPDPFHITNERLARKIRLENYYRTTNSENSDSILLKRYEHQMILTPVTVKSKKGYTGIFAGTLHVYEGKCTDFVCSNGILNCPNHRLNPAGGLSPNINVKPITGQQYVRVDEFNQPETIIYKSNCDEVKVANDFTLAIKGIYTAKEFYTDDYSKTPLGEPSHLSTIYWKASLPINSETDTKLSFYTSDITGRFRVVVQGITTEDVISGDYLFTVKGK